MRIALQGVSRRFGRREALTGIDMTLGTGVTGLLGPNGAGKTTIMSILATSLCPSSGSMHVNGHHAFEDGRPAAGIRAARSAIGLLPQRFELMELSSARRNVEVAAWAHGVPRDSCVEAAARALRAVDLMDRAGDRARSLSGGMRQRLGIACAIAHDPAIVLLDEPTAALDPVQRSELRRQLATLGESRLVLVSTHIVEDLAHMAGRVIVMREGAVVHDGDTASLSGWADPEDPSPLESGYRRILQQHARRAA